MPLELPPNKPKRKIQVLKEQALVGKFLELWPSLRTLEGWIDETKTSLFKGRMNLFVLGNGFFQFLFKDKEARDLVYKYIPNFMGSKGMFLAPWTLYFYLEMEISMAHVWVRMMYSHLFFGMTLISS